MPLGAFLVHHRPDVDAQPIGDWGISQAVYVMPVVLSRIDGIAFMIAVSHRGVACADQSAYLVSARAVCTGTPQGD
jgi:hypothetical protein